MSGLFSAKKLILGIGSQRAGSTFLHRLLDHGVQGIFMHPIKELHYFDSLFHLRNPQALKDFSTRQLERELKRRGLKTPEEEKLLPKYVQCYLRANRILASRKIQNVDYDDLFRPCIQDFSWFGEITPEYMLMSEQQIIQAKAIIGADKILPVMIVRKPRMRYLSAFKLSMVYGHDSTTISGRDSKKLLQLFKQHVRSHDGWNQCQDRYNSYIEATQLWRKHFEDDFLVLNFDQLVKRPYEAMSDLADQAGLSFDRDAIHSLAKTKVNDVGIKVELDDEAQELCDQRFGAQEKLVNNFMGEELML